MEPYINISFGTFQIGLKCMRYPTIGKNPNYFELKNNSVKMFGTNVWFYAAKDTGKMR